MCTWLLILHILRLCLRIYREKSNIQNEKLNHLTTSERRRILLRIIQIPKTTIICKKIRQLYFSTWEKNIDFSKTILAGNHFDVKCKIGNEMTSMSSVQIATVLKVAVKSMAKVMIFCVCVSLKVYTRDLHALLFRFSVKS